MLAVAPRDSGFSERLAPLQEGESRGGSCLRVGFPRQSGRGFTAFYGLACHPVSLAPDSRSDPKPAAFKGRGRRSHLSLWEPLKNRYFLNTFSSCFYLYSPFTDHRPQGSLSKV